MTCTFITTLAGVIVTKADNDAIKSFPDLKGCKFKINLQTSNWSKDARDNGAIIVTDDSLAQNA